MGARKTKDRRGAGGHRGGTATIGHAAFMVYLWGDNPGNAAQRFANTKRDAIACRGPGVAVDERGVPVGMPPMADYD
jgi:hypothetical protein